MRERPLFGAAVNGTASACFIHDYARESRQRRLQSLPDPSRDFLARRILQARNLIQKRVIQLLQHGSKCSLQLCEIANPPSSLIYLTRYMNPHTERMAVQPGTLVPLRNVRQAMRGLKAKFFKYFHLAQV